MRTKLSESDAFFTSLTCRILNTLLGPGLLGVSGMPPSFPEDRALDQLSVIGEQHKRQRKMLNPVFSTKHLREMMPVFRQVISKVRILGRVN